MPIKADEPRTAASTGARTLEFNLQGPAAILCFAMWFYLLAA
jgi:hypothetical protein